MLIMLINGSPLNNLFCLHLSHNIHDKPLWSVCTNQILVFCCRSATAVHVTRWNATAASPTPSARPSSSPPTQHSSVPSTVLPALAPSPANAPAPTSIQSPAVCTHHRLSHHVSACPAQSTHSRHDEPTLPIRPSPPATGHGATATRSHSGHCATQSMKAQKMVRKQKKM